MKLRHTKKDVVDWMIKCCDGKVTGYTKYNGKYFFYDGCGFCAILNKDYGYMPNLPGLKRQVTPEMINAICNDLRPNPCKDVTEFDGDLNHIHFTYKQILDWQKAANAEKKERNLKFRPSIRIANSWYNSDLILRAMELITNKYLDPTDEDFEAYYMESKGSLSAMWFFNSDGECAWVLPVRKPVEEDTIEKRSKTKK